METLLKELIIAVISVSVIFVSKAFVLFLEAKRKQLTIDIRFKDFYNTINQAIDIIKKATDMTSNAYVDALKKSGEFTAEAQKKAMLQTIKTVHTLLNPDVKLLLRETFSDVDNWIMTVVESYLRAQKFDLKYFNVSK